LCFDSQPVPIVVKECGRKVCLVGAVAGAGVFLILLEKRFFLDMTDYTDRIPPQAVDIERQVLGAMLFDGDAIPRAVEILDPGSFYRDAHVKIFSAIVSLFEQNEPVDGLTIVEELRKRRELEAVGGASYLAELIAEVATSANIEYHAKIVQEKALLRKTIVLSSQINFILEMHMSTL